MLAAGEALPAERTGSEQALPDEVGVVVLDSLYCYFLGLWLPFGKEEILESPASFIATISIRKKKRVCFMITATFTTYFYNCIGACNYVIINWSHFISTPVYNYRYVYTSSNIYIRVYTCISVNKIQCLHSLEVIMPGYQQSYPLQRPAKHCHGLSYHFSNQTASSLWMKPQPGFREIFTDVLNFP